LGAMVAAVAVVVHERWGPGTSDRSLRR